MRQNMAFSTKKYEKFSGERAAVPPPQTLPQWGGDTPPQSTHLTSPPPPRRLGLRDPFHSKILGTPLVKDIIKTSCYGYTYLISENNCKFANTVLIIQHGNSVVLPRTVQKSRVHVYLCVRCMSKDRFSLRCRQ